MTTFFKSKVQNDNSSTPYRCTGIYFADYSNHFKEAAEESMITVTLSRSQLWHYGDPFKSSGGITTTHFKKQQGQNIIVIIMQQMIQLLGLPFLKVTGGTVATLHKTSAGKTSFVQ